MHRRLGGGGHGCPRLLLFASCSLCPLGQDLGHTPQLGPGQPPALLLPHNHLNAHSPLSILPSCLGDKCISYCPLGKTEA